MGRDGGAAFLAQGFPQQEPRPCARTTHAPLAVALNFLGIANLRASSSRRRSRADVALRLRAPAANPEMG